MSEIKPEQISDETQTSVSCAFGYRLTKEDIACIVTAFSNCGFTVLKPGERDTQRQPKAGDWVVWIGFDGCLKTGKAYQIERQTQDGKYSLKGTDETWNCIIGTGSWRFATPEEIAAAQEQPKFKVGDVKEKAKFYGKGLQSSPPAKLDYGVFEHTTWNYIPEDEQ